MFLFPYWVFLSLYLMNNLFHYNYYPKLEETSVRKSKKLSLGLQSNLPTPFWYVHPWTWMPSCHPFCERTIIPIRRLLISCQKRLVHSFSFYGKTIGRAVLFIFTCCNSYCCNWCFWVSLLMLLRSNIYVVILFIVIVFTYFIPSCSLLKYSTLCFYFNHFMLFSHIVKNSILLLMPVASSFVLLPQ